ncbi:MAG: Tetratricopeptide 2 repeat protein, partial [Verrucomicrobiaceae bacterium]|nr:Tetratricopeptide 2 repeat protein [Verrucomicrobiaceae bacterium]
AFAGGFFVIALLPVAGLVDHYFLRYSFVGDHFVYLASMGPLALVAAGLTSLANRLGNKSWDALSLVCGALVVGLGFVSAAHVPIFKDDVTLWTDTLERNPSAWIAANNLGTAYLTIGRPDLARAHYERVLKKDGSNALATGNLGVAIMKSGSAKDAEAYYQNAIKTFPQEGSIFNNLGLAQSAQGRFKEAIESYKKAIAVSPKNGEAHLNLANALLKTGQFAEAVKHYQESIKFLPPKPATYHSLATALLGAGEAEAALEYYQKVLVAEPDSLVLHYNYGNALAQAGRMKEAVEAFQWAVKHKPDFIEAVHNLAWVLATTMDDAVRNGQEAVTVMKSIQNLPAAKEPVMLRTLAAAQFEAGDKAEALKNIQNALLLATVSNNIVLEHDLKSDLESYQQGKPVRNAPQKRQK